MEDNRVMNEFTIRVGKNGYLVLPDTYRSPELAISASSTYDFYVFENSESLEFFLKSKLIKPETDFKLLMGKALGRSKTD